MGRGTVLYRTRKKICVMILMGFSVLSGVGHAQLQRWTDDNGVIYYREVAVQDATSVENPVSNASANTRPSASQLPAKTPPATKKPTRRTVSPAEKARREQARAEARQERQCARLQARLDRIELQLGTGYREPEGNTLRHQRRELSAQWFRECR